MKKLSRINLHNLSLAELAKREEMLLRGGNDTIGRGILPCVCVVGCTCLYEGKPEGPNDPYYGGSTREVSGAVNSNNYQSKGDKEE